MNMNAPTSKPMTDREIDAYVGGRIRARRRALDITQVELADAIGVKFPQVQKYESGRNRVSASRMFLIAEVLRCSLLHFWDGLPAMYSLGPADRLQATPQDRMESRLLDAFRKCRPEVRAGLVTLLEDVDAKKAKP
jgi:transcriptional regulator with XRE-family HTH domain